ncbi:MAG: sugar phosphate isomerase/epimerase [Chloroflexi bacterium]|nr:sugar phosphate isomerase/epimerase [Chloroflexota bacterium]
MDNIQIGNAPCSWGTLEFGEMGGNRLTPTRMLDELAEAGYTGSELGDWGFMPTDPTVLTQEYAHRHLTITGAYVGVALEDPAKVGEGEAVVMQTARLLAAVADGLKTQVRPFIVLAGDNGADPVRTKNAGRVTPEMALSPTQWRTFADNANRIARQVCEETGLRTVFHAHCAGFVETPDEIAHLLAMTDPAWLGLVFDTGHYAFGAGSCATVLEALDRFADRIWYMHYKDCHPSVMAQAKRQQWDYFEAVRQGVFCELGQGCVDFPAVTAWLRQRHYTGFITVEQDVLPGMGAPKESAIRNRAYLQSIGL